MNAGAQSLGSGRLPSVCHFSARQAGEGQLQLGIGILPPKDLGHSDSIRNYLKHLRELTGKLVSEPKDLEFEFVKKSEAS